MTTVMRYDGAGRAVFSKLRCFCGESTWSGSVFASIRPTDAPSFSSLPKPTSQLALARHNLDSVSSLRHRCECNRIDTTELATNNFANGDFRKTMFPTNRH